MNFFIEGSDFLVQCSPTLFGGSTRRSFAFKTSPRRNASLLLPVIPSAPHRYRFFLSAAFLPSQIRDIFQPKNPGCVWHLIVYNDTDGSVISKSSTPQGLGVDTVRENLRYHSICIFSSRGFTDDLGVDTKRRLFSSTFVVWISWIGRLLGRILHTEWGLEWLPLGCSKQVC